MNDTVILGRDKEMIAVPWRAWLAHLDDAPAHGPIRLAFMTEEHHRVRYFVVRELPRAGTVLTPEFVAGALNMAENRVRQILADLERELFFLWRDEAGAVAWAYPVTVDRTPHVVRFSSGERSYGA